jgi:hypothetical protein
MPLANSLQFFDGTISTTIYKTKHPVSVIDMRGKFIAVGEQASPGQLISATLLTLDKLEEPKVFNYQKTGIQLIAVSPDGEFLCSVGSSSEQTYLYLEIDNS